MPESHGADLNPLDSRLLVYLPAWSKRTAIFVLGSLLVASLAYGGYLLLHPAGGDSGVELFIFVLSLVQTTAVALVFVVILFYSRRDASMATLVALSDEFLKKHMKSALERVSVPACGITSFEVQDRGRKDVFGHLFVLQANDLEVRLWIGLNVHRLFVIYFVGRDGREDFEQHARKVF